MRAMEVSGVHNEANSTRSSLPMLPQQASGGAVGAGWGTIVESNFSHNLAKSSQGGAVHVNLASLNVIDSFFWNNSAPKVRLAYHRCNGLLKRVSRYDGSPKELKHVTSVEM